MSTAEHTPGPWLDAGQLGHARLLLGADHTNIACFYSRDINPRALADFTIAKAAPDLSIARRWSALDAGSWHPVRYARERAELLADTQAAIAKAEPQS